MTEYLFSYGTLQEEGVQRNIFQRCLEGIQDILPGYRIAAHRMYDHYLVLEPSPEPRAGVTGMAYRISQDELIKADKYEGKAYRRVVAALASGKKAWVYVERKSDEIPE